MPAGCSSTQTRDWNLKLSSTPILMEMGYFDYIGFSSRTVMVNAWEGDVDFVVTLPGAYADQCGYEVRNPDGDLVVEDNVPGQDPGNALNVTVCDPGVSATANLEAQRDLHVHPNPATTFCQLQGLNGQEPWEAQMFGLDGKRILEQNGIGTDPLSVEGLTPGPVSPHRAVWRGRGPRFPPHEGVTQHRAWSWCGG